MFYQQFPFIGFCPRRTGIPFCLETKRNQKIQGRYHPSGNTAYPPHSVSERATPILLFRVSQHLCREHYDAAGVGCFAEGNLAARDHTLQGRVSCSNEWPKVYFLYLPGENYTNYGKDCYRKTAQANDAFSKPQIRYAEAGAENGFRSGI